MKGLTRKQVADKSGVTIEAVRFYEKEGIISEPPRTESGYRQYPETVIHQIRFVKRAQGLGFSLPEIKELLSMRVLPGTTTGDIRKRAKKKIQDIDEKIQTLHRIKETLEDITNACHEGLSLEDCPILKAFETTD